MNEWIARVEEFIDKKMWRLGTWWARSLQFLYMVGDGFVRDQLLMRSHGLTYITLLSLIPLLAITVAIASALGITEDLVGLAVEQIAAISPPMATWVEERVGTINFGSLGTVGAAALFVTTLLAIGNVEKSLNHIWGISKNRPMVRRIPDYLAVIVVAPVVLGVAISLGTTLRSQSVVGKLLTVPLFEAAYHHGLQLIPTAMYAIGFTFIYWFLPNTKVKILPALVGGAAAAALFTVLQAGYVGLNVGAAKLGVVFGSAAAVPFLIVFVYFAWTVILLGAEFSFAFQNLDRYRREVRGDVPGPASREAIGLGIALEIARRFEEGSDPCTADDLADSLDVRVRTIREILVALEEAGIVSELADEAETGQYQLARPAERIRVGDVLVTLRGARAPLVPAVDQVFERIEKQAQEVVERETLADLLRS